jgi:hypothetical protein
LSEAADREGEPRPGHLAEAAIIRAEAMARTVSHYRLETRNEILDGKVN